MSVKPRHQTARLSGSLKALWLAACLFVPMMTAHAIDIQSWHMDNGAKVLLVARHENPLVDIDIAFDAGSRRDTPDKIGAAGFAGGLMDAGAGADDEEALRRRIGDLAIDLASYSGLETAGVRLRSLSQADTLAAAVTLANTVLTQPRYDAAVLQREQDRAVLGLKQSETQPGFLANRALTRLNYPDHPYGYAARETEASIRALTRADLLAFHQGHFVANRAVISMVGDLTRAQAEAIARQLLQGLPEHAAPLPPLPAVKVSTGQSTHLPHPASQAHIAIGLPVFTRDDPDYYALLVGNYTLGGGGFDSRLMHTLRDRHGFTYGVGSGLSPLAQKGPFQLGFSTQKARSTEALAATRQVLADFIQQGPSEAELQQAKANIIGGFPLRFDTNQKLLGYLSVMGFYDLPLSFLDDYPAKVAALTPADIRAAWQRRIRAEDLNVVVVGGTPGPVNQTPKP